MTTQVEKKVITVSHDGRVVHAPMDNGLSDWVNVLCKTLTAWSAHRASSMGAALALYAISSPGPILVIALAIAEYRYHQSVQDCRW